MLVASGAVLRPTLSYFVIMRFLGVVGEELNNGRIVPAYEKKTLAIEAASASVPVRRRIRQRLPGSALERRLD